MHLTKEAIYIGVPSLSDSERMITLVIPVKNILKIQMFTGPNTAGSGCTPLIFITTTPRDHTHITSSLRRGRGFFFLHSMEKSRIRRGYS